MAKHDYEVEQDGISRCQGSGQEDCNTEEMRNVNEGNKAGGTWEDIITNNYLRKFYREHDAT